MKENKKKRTSTNWDLNPGLLFYFDALPLCYNHTLKGEIKHVQI